MTATQKTYHGYPYYVIERSGPSRTMWGPYESLDEARAACGVRCEVIVGDGLSDGRTLTNAAYDTLKACRSIKVIG